MGQVEWARDLARSLLEEQLPRRWAHTRGVAAQAETIRPILGNDADLVTAAAWLHDIGYSPTLAKTGFHPLDGARYLRDVHHADPRLCNLVAHHTCAMIEAEERGLAEELGREFAHLPDASQKALTYCDMTTGPDGERLTPDDRLREISSRYGPGHIVTASVRRAEPSLLEAFGAVQRQINCLKLKGKSEES
jgi:hypothetical protein